MKCVDVNRVVDKVNDIIESDIVRQVFIGFVIRKIDENVALTVEHFCCIL